MQLENSDLLFNLVLQISKSNRTFIQLLLNHGCISYSQLCCDILKVMRQCYHTPVETRKFHMALNSFITCYLQFVLHDSKKFNFTPKQHVNIFNGRDLFEAMSREFFQKTPCKNMCNSALAQAEEPNFVDYVARLRKIINRNSLDIDFDHLRIIQNSKLFDVCASVEDTKDTQIFRKQSIKHKRIVFAVDDFQTFLSPLKEDYTKSSKGYTICQNKTVVDQNQLSSIIEFLAEDDLFNSLDDSDMDESSSVDDNYDPVYDNIISRHFDSIKNLSSDSEMSLNGQVSDSDSDDSITFSGRLSKCTHYQIGYGAKPFKSDNTQRCDILSSESDSEDLEVVKNSLGSKFFKVSSFSELHDSDLAETSDSGSFEVCDKNSSQVCRSFNQEFSFVSNSLSQGNVQIYSSYFDGFINPCFEDDDVVIVENELMRNVNDEWDRNMQNVSCEPREPKKVSFVPMPNLVTIKTFERDDDGYHFGLYLLNQVRFKNRIEEFEKVIKPYLSAKHRANMYKNYFSNNQLLM